MKNEPNPTDADAKDWVRDDEKTRGFDGKTVEITDRNGQTGIYLMKVSETNAKGERRPGFVQLLVTPYDLKAAMNKPLRLSEDE